TVFQPWAKMVPLGNRVNSVPGDAASGAQIPQKPIEIKGPAIQSGDTPEVRIRQGRFHDLPGRNNSKALFFSQVFMIQLGTSTPLLDIAPLNRLKWLTRLAL